MGLPAHDRHMIELSIEEKEPNILLDLEDFFSRPIPELWRRQKKCLRYFKAM